MIYTSKGGWAEGQEGGTGDSNTCVLRLCSAQGASCEADSKPFDTSAYISYLPLPLLRSLPHPLVVRSSIYSSSLVIPSSSSPPPPPLPLPSLPPTDMVKTRLQSGNALYTGPISAAKAILKSEGVAGFYRGTCYTPLSHIPSPPPPSPVILLARLWLFALLTDPLPPSLPPSLTLSFPGLGANLAGVTPEKAIKLAANDLLREALELPDGTLPLHREMMAGAGKKGGREGGREGGRW